MLVEVWVPELEGLLGEVIKDSVREQARLEDCIALKEGKLRFGDEFPSRGFQTKHSSLI